MSDKITIDEFVSVVQNIFPAVSREDAEDLLQTFESLGFTIKQDERILREKESK